MVSTDELPAVDLLVQRLSQGSSVWEIRGALLAYVAVVTALEATNAALVEFVKAEDAWNAHAESGDWDEDDTLYHAMIAARQTLATDHGIPLPGEGVGS